MAMLELLATIGAKRFTAPAQFLRPIADGSSGFQRFPPSGGRYDKVDEVVSDGDSTYIWQTGFGGSGSEEVDLELTNSGIVAPDPRQDVVCHFVQKDANGLGLTGGWSAWLYEGDPGAGGTLRATLFNNHPGPPNGTYVDIADTLNASEQASITDWNDLWFRIFADFTAETDIWRLTQCYIEIEEVL